MNETKTNRFKKAHTILNIITGSSIGVFVGHAIYVLWEYQKYPGLYAMQSAPWYTGIIVYGIGAAVISGIAVLIKFILKKKQNADEGD